MKDERGDGRGKDTGAWIQEAHTQCVFFKSLLMLLFLPRKSSHSKSLLV